MSRRSRKPQPEASPPAPERPAPRIAPRWLLALVTISLPFLLLALAEAGLRLAGYGEDLEPVFIDAPGMPGWRQANPRAVLRLFADPAEAPAVSIETAYFRQEKPPGALRLVVQGESSAAGFPYGLGASPAGVLEQRLRRSWPEREIEVVSTALSAVNSWALVDFADEILAQRPDAVVVYVGHNEYLGILGVGSTFRVPGGWWVTRSTLAVRELRLFQLLRALLPRRAPAARPEAAADSLMARVAGERAIPLGSPLHRRGLEQFERNLERLLARYRRAGVPVFVGTLAANERDQPPFAGEAARDTFERARRADAGDGPAAAAALYREARDLDELRFRAPSGFNEVIRRVAERQGATVVEVERRLSGESPGGVVGGELMLEHVHPNLDGYFLLADAFYDAIVDSGLAGTPQVRVDDAEARREMPVTEVDRWLGEYKTARILAGWPFAATRREPALPPARTEGERLAQLLYAERIDWPRAQDQLRRHYAEQGDQAGYAAVTRVLADAFPTAARLQFEAAAALVGLGQPLDALRYARRAREQEPSAVDPWLVSGHALALLGRDGEAREALGRALALEPGNATAKSALEALAAREAASGAP